VLGLYNMAAIMGLRALSGITVGLAATPTNIHVSLASSAATFALVMGLLSWRLGRGPSASLAADHS